MSSNIVASGIRRRLPAEDRRRQVLSVARRVFAERGYEDTSIDEIAAAAGVTKPIVYRHFEGKHDLYQAVLEEHLGDLIKRLWVALASSADPKERLRAGLTAYFEFVGERPDGFAIIAEAGMRRVHRQNAQLAAAWDALAEGVARTVGDVLRGNGLDPAGAPIYARALIGMTQAVAMWWLRARKHTVDELVDHLLALTWRGFDGLPRHPHADDRF